MTPDIVYYYIDMANYHEKRARLTSYLDVKEQAQAMQFVFEKNREEFIIRRGLLRVILSHALSVLPTQIHYHMNPQGKLSLEGIQFNLSSTDQHLFIAHHPTLPVGVDIEYMKPLTEFDALVATFASPREIHAFSQLEKGDKRAAFFALWTRKEAFLKAIGRGFDYPSQQMSVTCHGKPVILEIMDDDPQAWQLFSIEPTPATCAAVAVRDKKVGLARGNLDRINVE